MRVTARTREALAEQRAVRGLLRQGYELISENGDPLWRFVRGGRTREKIVDARVTPQGHVYIKAAG